MPDIAGVRPRKGTLGGSLLEGVNYRLLHLCSAFNVSIALNKTSKRDALEDFRITRQIASVDLNLDLSCPSFGVFEHVKGT
jgi:hypothetical protein